MILLVIILSKGNLWDRSPETLSQFNEIWHKLLKRHLQNHFVLYNQHLWVKREKYVQMNKSDIWKHLKIWFRTIYAILAKLGSNLFSYVKGIHVCRNIWPCFIVFFSHAEMQFWLDLIAIAIRFLHLVD